MKNDNRIIYGDNLHNLQKIDTESIDLVYIDPPFFTGKDWSIVVDGVERSYTDKWNSDMNYYLMFMRSRLKEAHRVLKSTGSIYLHCDDNALGELIVEMNEIFGRKNRRNINNWKKTFMKQVSSRKFYDQTDYILFYSKSDNYTFNIQYQPITDKRLKEYKYEDEKGKFKVERLEIRENKTKSFELNYNGKILTPRKGFGFAWSQNKLDKELLTNKIPFYQSSTGLYYKKIYLKDYKGETITNRWDDINPISSHSKERVGYATQKPVELIERIVKTSSNEGETILDFFGGSGTTGHACLNLNRKFILMDQEEEACRVMAKRFGWNTHDVENMILSVSEIANISGNEFQDYVLDKFAFDYPNLIRNNGRGADDGIDGFFNNYPMEVKKTSKPATRNHVTVLHRGMIKHNKKKAIFISYSGYSSVFISEYNRLKIDDSELEIYQLTYKDIVDGKHEEVIQKLI